MKLDKWPEEIECEGWVWAKRYLSIRDTDDTLTYIRKEKLRVPPTMREIMEHLLKGGEVLEEAGTGRWRYRLRSDSSLELALEPHLETWSPAVLALGSSRGVKFTLL